MPRMDIPPTMSFQPKDAHQPLRFAPPSTPPPFEKKRLTLKQAEPSGLEEEGRHATTLFSVWFDTWKDNTAGDIEDAQTFLKSLSTARSGYEVITEERPNRRFSGDGFLAASRYFSVCDSNDGRDGGTLLRELTAYHDPWTKGIVDIVDLADNPAEDVSHINAQARNDGVARGPGILISIPPFTATEYDWLQSAAMRWEPTRVVLPTCISEITFERVVDLRVPRMANWFTQNLTRLQWLTGDGSFAPAFPRKAPLDSFQELIPTLAVQIHGGGNGATRIAGQWLRSLGADALVYPSARSDASVTVARGEVTSFYGWCLVDYRGAHPARLQTFDLTSDWLQRVATEIDGPPLHVYSDIALETEGAGHGFGSWTLRNVEQGNQAIRRFASALYLFTWANRGVSRERLQMLGELLGGSDSAEVMGGTATAFGHAILGEHKARQALIDLAQELSSDIARNVDLAGTFSRMDQRVAAGKQRALR